MAVPLPVQTTFSYRAAGPLPRGVRVLVPFGPRRVIGVVTGTAAPTDGALKGARIGVARDFMGAGFDAHLVETHHTEKKDAPSGTGRLLADRAGAAAGRTVPVTSVRVGQVPGTHELVLDAGFEQVRLVHEARDRRVFAAGALAAARWLVGRTGVFTMDDMLGMS